jgi:hypothetical protein
VSAFCSVSQKEAAGKFLAAYAPQLREASVHVFLAGTGAVMAMGAKDAELLVQPLLRASPGPATLRELHTFLMFNGERDALQTVRLAPSLFTRLGGEVVAMNPGRDIALLNEEIAALLACSHTLDYHGPFASFVERLAHVFSAFHPLPPLQHLALCRNLRTLDLTSVGIQLPADYVFPPLPRLETLRAFWTETPPRDFIDALRQLRSACPRLRVIMIATAAVEFSQMATRFAEALRAPPLLDSLLVQFQVRGRPPSQDWDEWSKQFIWTSVNVYEEVDQ